MSTKVAAQSITADSPFQTHYAANLSIADTIVNISNTGANGAPLYGPGIGVPAGNICVNVYAFGPGGHLVSCCSCHVTPGGLVSLSASNDLVTNTLTSYVPPSLVITLVATATGKDQVMGTPAYSGSASSCANSAAGAGGYWPIAASGLAAWGTNVHRTSGVSLDFSITESPFRPATMNDEELASLTNRCAFIIGNGSGYGICRSCSPGGRSAFRR